MIIDYTKYSLQKCCMIWVTCNITKHKIKIYSCQYHTNWQCAICTVKPEQAYASLYKARGARMAFQTLWPKQNCPLVGEYSRQWLFTLIQLIHPHLNVAYRINAQKRCRPRCVKGAVPCLSLVLLYKIVRFRCASWERSPSLRSA